jgi:hypothetical protein
MAASLDDILTTQKNGVVSINVINQELIVSQAVIEKSVINTSAAVPSLMSPTVAASTTQLIVAGSGRIFTVTIPTYSGGSHIRIYDCATTGGISGSNAIFTSLPSNTSGWQTYYNVNLAYTNGIVIVTDASTSCAVSYTPAS